MRARPPARARAWSLVLAWVVLLYATGAFAFDLVQFTRRYVPLAVYAWIAGLLLCGLAAALVRRALRRGLAGRIGLGAVAALFLLLFALTPGGVAKLHLVQFSVLAGLLVSALRLHLGDASAYAVALSLAAVVGASDELLQGFHPDRVGDLADVQVNLAAAALGLVAWALVSDAPLPLRMRPASLRWAGLAGAAALLSLAAFYAFNPDLRYGMLHADTPAGSFVSSLSLEQLAAADRDPSHARRLARWHGADRRDFMQRLSELERQARLDAPTRLLFAQIYDHTLYRNRLMEHFQPQAASVEAAIGDALYAGLLSAAPPGWNDVVEERLAHEWRRAPLAPPHAAGYVPEGSPLYSVTAPDGAWSAESRLPAASLEAMLPRLSRRYRALAEEMFLSDYRRFLREHKGREHAFLRELRVHLFLRDRYAYWCDYRVAWGENRILETYFGETLRATPYVWPPEVGARLEAAGYADPDFRSRVGEDYRLGASPARAWAFGGLALLLLSALLPRLWPGRRRGGGFPRG